MDKPTVEGRAQAILTAWGTREVRGQSDCDWIKKMIAEQIQQACTDILEQNEVLVKVRIDAARAEAQSTTHCKTHCGCFAYNQAYAKGFAEGREKAAKKVDEMSKEIGGCQEGCTCGIDSDEIRALERDK